MDEDEVVDGGNQLTTLLSVALNLLADHGDVVLDLQAVELGLDLELTAVGAVHGEPVHD